MKFDNKQRVLVISSHPDDETLGAGGTIAKFRASGSEVRVHFLGEGVTARFSDAEIDSKEAKEQSIFRKECSIRALGLLGVEIFSFSERLCTQFDTYSMRSIVREIEDVMEDYHPTIILTHNRSDVNVDHRITYEAVEVASRPHGRNYLQAVYSFEIICSSGWKFRDRFEPNCFVDISNYIEQKIQAWNEYSGEQRPFPFPRCDEGLRVLAAYRGMMSGFKSAEGFELLRSFYS